jgi:hypothetical protein
MCCAYGCCIRTGMLSSYHVVLQVQPKSTTIVFSEWSHKKDSREVPVALEQTSAWYGHVGQITSGVPEGCVCIIWSRLYHASLLALYSRQAGFPKKKPD